MNIGSRSVSGVSVNSVRSNCSLTLTGLATAASAAGRKWSVSVKPEHISEGMSNSDVCVTKQPC